MADPTAKERVAFERWFKRSEQYAMTVRGLSEALEYRNGAYYYGSVDYAWRAFKAGRRVK